MAPKWGFWSFDRNLIDLYVLFLLECESTNDIQTFCKNHVWEKCVAWVMFQEPLNQSECRVL